MWTSSLPSVALPGLERVRIMVSLASSRESLTMLAMLIVPVVAPALIVKVPLAKVKSVPLPVAVPVIA